MAVEHEGVLTACGVDLVELGYLLVRILILAKY